MNVDLFIGIDAGKSNGGIAWYGNKKSKAIKIPQGEKAIQQSIKGLTELSGTKVCAIEKLSLRQTDFMQGRFVNMETMIRNHQTLIDCLVFYGIPYFDVHPKTWQSYLKLKKEYEEGINYKELYTLMINKNANIKRINKINYEIKKARKNRYKQYSQKLYPDFKQTDWSADAFCLVTFLRYKQMREPEYFDEINYINSFLI